MSIFEYKPIHQSITAGDGAKIEANPSIGDTVKKSSVKKQYFLAKTPIASGVFASIGLILKAINYFAEYKPLDFVSSSWFTFLIIALLMICLISLIYRWRAKKKYESLSKSTQQSLPKPELPQPIPVISTQPKSPQVTSEENSNDGGMTILQAKTEFTILEAALWAAGLSLEHRRRDTLGSFVLDTKLTTIEQREEFNEYLKFLNNAVEGRVLIPIVCIDKNGNINARSFFLKKDIIELFKNNKPEIYDKFFNKPEGNPKR